MRDAAPIFRAKDGAQIGYLENDGAFDLSGRRRCDYNAASGNLRDSSTGEILGHVSLDGHFVGCSWIAADLFGRAGEERETNAATAKLAQLSGPDLSRPDLSRPLAPPLASESSARPQPVTAARTGAAAPAESEDLSVERAMGVIRGVLRERR